MLRPTVIYMNIMQTVKRYEIEIENHKRNTEKKRKTWHE